MTGHMNSPRVRRRDGSAGLVQATQMVTSYFDPATKLIYAAGALCGLIGAIKVYSKFSSGDPDTGKLPAAGSEPACS